MSPNLRTRRRLERDGALVATTEQWIRVPAMRSGGIRRDAFGFADMIAVHQDGRVALVQATSADNRSHRRVKISAIPAALELVRRGISVEVWSWSVPAKSRIYRCVVDSLGKDGEWSERA